MARENILLDVHQETNGWYRCKAVGGGGRVQGEPWGGGGLTAAVKAGNAGFRIESY